MFEMSQMTKNMFFLFYLEPNYYRMSLNNSVRTNILSNNTGIHDVSLHDWINCCKMYIIGHNYHGQDSHAGNLSVNNYAGRGINVREYYSPETISSISVRFFTPELEVSDI